ncbi:hypothetical protein DPEC_G00030010 [Dallia pectoralis]|uniref:Uncharacterized protein n=1 Tax=Dallia pectoralis TaxID=75939 RepID=A0ACC2HBW0_DALPE|nr:hypothetical protein DPEC_G00030010 [Dallia pectoralis]
MPHNHTHCSLKLTMMVPNGIGPHDFGPHDISRATERLEFCDCKKGLGVKIIGGYRNQMEEKFGIFIKRVLPGGLAAQDGVLSSSSSLA